VVQYPWWRGLAQVEWGDMLCPIKMPGEGFVTNDEFNNIAADDVHVPGIGRNDDRSRCCRDWCRITQKITAHH
jgi:hypothetical protein